VRCLTRGVYESEGRSGALLWEELRYLASEPSYLPLHCLAPAGVAPAA